MKRCLAILLCLACISHAGMVKQSPRIEQPSKQQKQAFNQQGEVELQPLVDSEEGESIAFKVKDKIILGVVKQKLVDPKLGIKIFGDFPGYEKAGFVFMFGSLPNGDAVVKGSLFFVDTGKAYMLSFDADKKALIFKEQDITVREVPNN